jgi:hypothetical protein
MPFDSCIFLIYEIFNNTGEWDGLAKDKST